VLFSKRYLESVGSVELHVSILVEMHIDAHCSHQRQISSLLLNNCESNDCLSTPFFSFTLAPAAKFAFHTARQDPVQKLRGSNLDEEIAITMPCHNKNKTKTKMRRTCHSRTLDAHLGGVVDSASAGGVVVSNVVFALFLSSTSHVFVLASKMIRRVHASRHFARNVIKRNCVPRHRIKIPEKKNDFRFKQTRKNEHKTKES
jgi:hypothetical protein